jgi:serine phosphatase RsbU (regulator of sigma subunit)
MTPESSEKMTILAVDDKLENLKVLIKYLEDSGFELMVAQSGEETFKHIERIIPDIILLDVLMPGIDGFETCRRLKENETTKDIPVIFMTALTDTVDKVKGFEVGAVDYLTKPLQHEEVLARVNAHMTIREFQQQLQEQNVLLQQTNSQLRKYTDKINADIDRARIVQQRFLPAIDNMPCQDKINWAHSFEPADQVGGDYFDAGVIDENRLAILFSDVCGHGMSAAFITAILKTTFQAWLDCKTTLQELAANLNANLYRLTPSDSYAAVFIAIYDVSSGSCQYINFGHHPEPWLIPAEKSTSIQALNNASSLVLGIEKKIKFPVAELTLQAGDSMIFISDGIIENCSPDEIDEDDFMYGTDQFETLLEKNRSLSVSKMVEEIRNEMNNYTAATEQFDDRTILAFKIKN